MTPIVLFLMCWAALIAAGDTQIGQLMHSSMVQLPTVAANRLTRGNVAIAIAVLLLIVLHVTAEDGDRVRMAGLAIPELTIWLTTFEISTAIETTTGLTVAWGTIRRLRVSAVLTVPFFGFAALTKSKARRVRRNFRRSCVWPANDDGAGLPLAAQNKRLPIGPGTTSFNHTGAHTGSRLIGHSQKITVAARAITKNKPVVHRS